MRRRTLLGLGLFALFLFGLGGGAVLLRKGGAGDASIDRRDGTDIRDRRSRSSEGALREAAERELAEERGEEERAEREERSSKRKDVLVPAELARFGPEGREEIGLGRLSWKRGDRWEVESYYKRMERPGKEEWSDSPIRWKFEVVGREKVDGIDAYVLEVHPADLSEMPYDPGGKVYVSVEDQTVLALRDRVLEGGRVRDRFLKFTEPTGGAYSTLIPIELPAPESKGSTFPGMTAAGTPVPFDSQPKIELPKTTGKVVEVSFKANGVTILQRWDTDHPNWPVYSSTPYRVSVLRKGS